MDLSIDMLSVNDADAFVIWIKENGYDYLIFLDGGKKGDGNNVITHYNTYIRPYLNSTPTIIVINTHPHRDHLLGLFEIVEYFKDDIRRVYFNNPLDYVDSMQKNLIFENYLSTQSKQAEALYESLTEAEDFVKLIKKYKIECCEIFSDITFDHTLFKVLGPSQKFYNDRVQYFTSLTSLDDSSLIKEAESSVNEISEERIPCEIVDEKNDASPENLSSVILQFTDSSGRRYLFTGDAGVDSFQSASENGYDMTNFHIAQLPHHGSRRNVNTNWLCNFNPKQYWVSAAGNKKHPRRAVIECIKKNLPNCRIYGTHRGGTKNFRTNILSFPDREGWSSAVSL